MNEHLITAALHEIWYTFVSPLSSMIHVYETLPSECHCVDSPWISNHNPIPSTAITLRERH